MSMRLSLYSRQKVRLYRRLSSRFSTEPVTLHFIQTPATYELVAFSYNNKQKRLPSRKDIGQGRLHMPNLDMAPHNERFLLLWRRYLYNNHTLKILDSL